MPTALVADQPELQARPLFGRSSTESSLRLASTKSKSKVQSPKFGFFGRQRNHSDASSRQMLISRPTDFRHLTSGSQHAFPAMPLSMNPPALECSRAPQMREFLRFPRQAVSAHDWELECRRESPAALEPLELSIYRTQSRLSPLLPQFELPIMAPSPPPAYASEEAERSPVLNSQRSMPSLTRGLRGATAESLPRSPGVSEGHSSSRSPTCATTTSNQTTRSRSHTAPDVEAIRARVANAMQEVERLQKRIDAVVERQSLYTPSRPSSAHSSRSFARTLPDLEPMPSIPALPPSAPSFAERLHDEADILPARAATLSITPCAVSGTAAQSTAGHRRRLPALEGDEFSKAMPPPLPLVLRPPLRKKKPFPEGLSGFVFPVPPRQSSLDSVTNMPRPIKGTEGFYQCVPVDGAHTSYESLHSLASSDDGVSSEARSTRAPYSPSTPHELPIERCATFGQDTSGLPMSVDIAL
ncbi:hypothetical protein LLEC1_03215 [Akanthomyces lecanii]|uniref:Uncharacterized protein n=1 Tax=Cordyceps confragosa TaxID=2714763 RepID=A0A179I3W9_CORDF|nr:hypothetical protein LLEC1_03215 [Akanthomyces lecanii]